jgi:hypothetical protein
VSDAPNRKDAREALRRAGFSSRQVDALFRSGWRGLVGAKDAEIAELQDAVDAMAERLAVPKRVKLVEFPRSSQDSAEPTQD